MHTYIMNFSAAATPAIATAAATTATDAVSVAAFNAMPHSMHNIWPKMNATSFYSRK